MRTLVLILLAGLASQTWAQPVVVAPGTVPVGGHAELEVQGLTAPETLSWTVIPEVTVRPARAWDTGNPLLAIPASTPGTWSVVVMAVEDGQVWHQTVPLTVGTAPEPLPPTPPTPAPLRVLITHETVELADYSVILLSPDLRGYLDAHCEKSSHGQPEWRIWDDDFPPGDILDPWYREAYTEAVAESRSPWIVIDNGAARYSGPLPPRLDLVLELLQTYGGP